MPQTDPRHDQSVGRILAKRLATLGDAPLIVADGGNLTYGEVDRASNRLANGIEALGILPGETVLAMMPHLQHRLACKAFRVFSKYISVVCAHLE